MHQPFDLEQLTQALTMSGVGMWYWDILTDQVRWSVELEKLHGLQPGEFDGSMAMALSLIPDEEREATRQRIADALSSSKTSFESQGWRIRKSDGLKVRLSGWGHILYDESGKAIAMLGVAIDTTNKYADETRLKIQSEQIRLYTELATDYVYQVVFPALSPKPEIVAGSFERTTGYTPEQVEAVGGWIEIIHPDDRGLASEAIPSLFEGRPVISEYRIVRPDGEIRWLRDHVRPILEKGELKKIVGGVQDISEQKSLEEQLQQSKKLETLAQLSGAVAHDFNNVLTVMTAGLESLGDSLDQTQDAKEILEDMQLALRRAAELTTSLLAFGRRSGGDFTTLDLSRLVSNCRSLFSRALDRSISIVLDVKSDIKIDGEQGQLEMLLLNLIINARDANPKDSKIHVDLHEVDFLDEQIEAPAGFVGKRAVVLSVRDRGDGMSDEVKDRIFEPFFTTKEDGKGTGLG